MGCSLTKRENYIMRNDELSDTSGQQNINYKFCLERKMCLAKETPELEYDLSDCNLKDIPTGVFIVCRVLRKEVLDLSRNRLISLNGGGPLSELYLLKILDLRYNKIKILPNEIYKLENLRELYVSNNLLIKLPKVIKDLKYLEILDISNNNIQSIDEISYMPSLKVLNIKGNSNINKLPITLSTCNHLSDLLIDADTINWPPIDILATTTLNIINFLKTGNMDYNKEQKEFNEIEAGTECSESNNSRCDEHNPVVLREEKNRQDITTHPMKIDLNESRKNDDAYENIMVKEIQMRQQEQKQKLLETVVNQQYKTDILVNKIQHEKNNEKCKLIKHVLEDEQNTNLIIENLLKIKNSLDNSLLEKEKLVQERLLEKLHFKQSELRKQEILSTMLDTLYDEECRIQEYQSRKLSTSCNILGKEMETSAYLSQFFQMYEKNRNELTKKISESEELQKQAVLNLLTKNDTRTWGLVEQIRIIEAQLAKLTRLELERKSNLTSEHLNNLLHERMNLTGVFLELLDHQENRKKQILNTVLSMEAQRCNEQNFWLYQYQRLLDSKHLEFSVKMNSIDPLLGYYFLVNGVIHCLPFLQKLWQTHGTHIEQIKDDDLIAVGVRSEKDRKSILKSIKEFLNNTTNDSAKNNVNNDYNIENYNYPSAPPMTSSSSYYGSGSIDFDDSKSLDETTSATSECVICMCTKAKIVFLPCGHMCCCFDCTEKVKICPICRTDIENKIRVIQP